MWEPEIKNWQEVVENYVERSIRRQWIPMRDGIRLDTNIYFPYSMFTAFPIILIRSPYPEKAVMDRYAKLYKAFLEHEYCIVYQYERGRYWSEGNSVFLANAKEDGYDTVSWLAMQAWSNGKVGTMGCSSSAENQLSLAVANHPAHVAAIAQAPGAGIGKIGPYCEQGNHFRGGALQLFFASWFNEAIMYGKRGCDHRPQFPVNLSQDRRVRISMNFDLDSIHQWGQHRPDIDYKTYYQHLPVCELNSAIQGGLTDWDDFAARSPSDPAWGDTSFINEGDRVGVPILWVFSWFDIAVAPNVWFYNHVCKNGSESNQFLLIGPMGHCAFGEESINTKVGEREIGDARYDYLQRYLEWFDHWLKNDVNKALDRPKVTYYKLGANQWVFSDKFPPPQHAFHELFLCSQGGANTLHGDGLLMPSSESELSANSPDFVKDTFIYDPLHPVPTLGGGVCCMGDIASAGSFDQSDLEMRNDILVYSSKPLKEPLDVTGYVEVELYISSSARDTDFSVKLIDVYPDGRAFNLDDTIFRVRYRDGYERIALIEPNEIYKIVFPPMITSNVFLAGHQIRLEISSSNFPRYDRNLNTGGNNFDEKVPLIAKNSIYHSAKFPSKLRLPVGVSI